MYGALLVAFAFYFGSGAAVVEVHVDGAAIAVRLEDEVLVGVVLPVGHKLLLARGIQALQP